MIDALKRLAEVSPISTWALFGAGVALSMMLAGMVMILWLGGWSWASEHQRIDYLGVIAILLALDLAVVITALARARASVRAPGGVSFDISSDPGTPLASSATVTTTTEIKK